MSFILDALKKSEIERQRQAIPGLMDSGLAPRARGFPLWAIALVVLLGINLIVLGYVLTQRGAPAARASGAGLPAAASQAGSTGGTPAALPQVSAPARAAPAGSPAAGGPAAGSSAATAPTPAQAANDAPAAAEHFSPLDAAPVYAPEIPPDSPAAGGGASAAARAPMMPSEHTSHRRATAASDPPQAEDDKPDAETLPTINEIDLTGQPALSGLHLDVHVYATNPADRFVYINMHKYREGSTLQEGPTLERIRRDGVILNFNGLRFVLPRQQ
jgi:general secretion pathway protein B